MEEDKLEVDKLEVDTGKEQIINTDLPIPLLPLRDVVVFPHMVIPLFVGRAKSIKAMEVSMESGQHILLATQKNASQNEPTFEDLFKTGCLANILQMLKLPDGTVKVLVEGVQRAKVNDLYDSKDFFSVNCEIIENDTVIGPEHEALRRTIISQFEQFVKLNKKISSELLSSVSGLEDFGRLADTIAAHLPLKIEDKQEVLEISTVVERMERLLAHIETELDILQV
jgi:ATP-dependent Lon protease